MIQLENGLWLRTIAEPDTRFASDVLRIDYAVWHSQHSESDEPFDFVGRLEGEGGLYKRLERAKKDGYAAGVLALAGDDEYASFRVGYAWGTSARNWLQPGLVAEVQAVTLPSYDDRALRGAMSTHCFQGLLQQAEAAADRPGKLRRYSGMLMRGLGILPVDSTWPIGRQRT